MAECVIREMSPREFHREFGVAKLAKIEGAFELLVQYEWLQPVESDEAVPEPDPADRVHRACEAPLVEQDAWWELPDSTRALIASRVLEMLNQRARAAMKAGTLSGRPDHHVSWDVLELDREGWDAVFSKVEGVLRSLPAEKERARARMAESGEEPAQMTVGLLAFESPRPGTKTRF
jgi:hypothetical protein